MARIDKDFLNGTFNFQILTEEYGWTPESFSGDEAIGKCPNPNHDDRNPSFAINMKTGKFQCFSASCGIKGNRLSSLVSSVNPHFSTSEIKREMIRLAKKYGYLEDDEFETLLLQIRKGRDEDFWKVHKNLNKDLLDRFNIGKVEKMYVDKSKVVGKLSAFYNRYVYPIYYKGELIGFQGRAIKEDDIKYLTIKLRKERFVFYEDIKDSSTLVIVEGVRDAIKVLEAGYSAMALLNANARSRLEKLKDYIPEFNKYEKIVLLLDGDAAGIDAMNKTRQVRDLNILVKLYAGLLHPDDGRKADPKDATVEEIKDAVENSKHVYTEMFDSYIENLFKRYGNNVIKNIPLIFKAFISNFALNSNDYVDKKTIDLIYKTFENSIYNYIENINNQAEANDETH